MGVSWSDQSKQDRPQIILLLMFPIRVCTNPSVRSPLIMVEEEAQQLRTSNQISFVKCNF